MSNNDMVSVPQSLFERLMAFIPGRSVADDGGTPPPPPAPDPAASEQYTAAVKERDQYKAEVEALKARQTAQARVDKFSAELQPTKLSGLEGAPEMLAGMTDEQSAWVLQQFKALSEQIDASGDGITKDVGDTGGTDQANPIQQFHAAILVAQNEHKLSYPDAVQRVATEQPDLYAAWARR